VGPGSRSFFGFGGWMKAPEEYSPIACGAGYARQIADLPWLVGLPASLTAAAPLCAFLRRGDDRKNPLSEPDFSVMPRLEEPPDCSAPCASYLRRTRRMWPAPVSLPQSEVRDMALGVHCFFERGGRQGADDGLFVRRRMGWGTCLRRPKGMMPSGLPTSLTRVYAGGR